MLSGIENCAHLKGLQVTAGTGYRCPDCQKVLDISDVAEWVREAERDRDETYLMVEGEELTRIARDESQREVYRRRKLLYELRDTPKAVARPEMLLVVYDVQSKCYECRIFYKEPKPTWCIERLRVGASEAEIKNLGFHSNPVVRTVAEKVSEFHSDRKATSKRALGELALTRRVFYANEL